MDVETAIKMIMESTGLSKQEIVKKIQTKISELSGLIDEQGAVVMVAADHGVNLSQDHEAQRSESFTPIKDLTDGQANVNIVGRIAILGDIVTFQKKQTGGIGKLLKFVVTDKTGDVMVIAWDNHADIKSNSAFAINSVVQVLNAKVKKNTMTNKNEIHLDINSGVLFDSENADLTLIPDSRELSATKNIKDVNPATDRVANLKVQILDIYEPREFTSKDGTVSKSRSIRISDETGSAFISFWRHDISIIDSLNQGQIVEFFNLSVKPNYKDNTRPDFTWARSSKYNVIGTQPISPPQSQPQAGQGAAGQQGSNQGSGIVSIKQLKDGVVQNGNISVVVTSVGNLRTVNTRNGPAVLLDVNIGDDSDGSQITLWKEQAEEFQDLKINDPLTITNVYAKMNNYTNSMEINLTMKSQIIRETTTNVKKPILVNRDTQGVSSTGGQSDSNSSGSTQEFKTVRLADINSEELVSVNALILKEIKKITTYTGCKTCRRKQENCTCQEFVSQEYMIMNLIIDDESTTMRATIGDNLAKHVLGITADEYIDAENRGDLDSLFQQINMKIAGKTFIFNGKAKFSTYSNQYELQVYRMGEFDPKAAAQTLYEELQPLV